ncbi:hypothetical protein GCM10010238_67840 [Streptomyces griseoviridis]|uniref:Uncharacterized protein n=1 Tax=Streptomyces griseoviridis TaxID=45398 RepID=A0A918LL87_STRGD|nr:hypothetical protein GCM10010238_67840 [Streptomyces niveoruber]
MNDAVVALLGATVGALGSGGAAYLTGRMTRRQVREQLAAQRTHLEQQLAEQRRQFEEQTAEQRRQFEEQTAEQRRQFEEQTSEQYRQFEAQSRADHIRSRRDYRADAYKEFLKHASAVKSTLSPNGRITYVTDQALLVDSVRDMEAALGAVQVEGPRTVSEPAERMVLIARGAARNLSYESAMGCLEAGVATTFNSALISFTNACSAALNDESLPNMKPAEIRGRTGQFQRTLPHRD